MEKHQLANGQVTVWVENEGLVIHHANGLTIALTQEETWELFNWMQQPAEEEPKCICGNEISWINRFFDAPENHIEDCPDCRQHTLHLSEDCARCLNPVCNHSSGVDAEGNVYRNGQIVSNGGKGIDQLRNEYFDGYSFMVG